MPDIEDIIEDELLEDQEDYGIKKEKTMIEDNSPKESTSYRDRLVNIYNELNNLDKNDIDNDLEKIKAELKKVIKDLKDSERKLEEINSNKIDKEMQQDKDLHYLPKTKGDMSKEASDNFFCKKNMIIIGLSAFSILLIVMLFAVLLFK